MRRCYRPEAEVAAIVPVCHASPLDANDAFTNWAPMALLPRWNGTKASERRERAEPLAASRAMSIDASCWRSSGAVWRLEQQLHGAERRLSMTFFGTKGDVTLNDVCSVFVMEWDRARRSTLSSPDPTLWVAKVVNTEQGRAIFHAYRLLHHTLQAWHEQRRAPVTACLPRNALHLVELKEREERKGQVHGHQTVEEYDTVA